MPFKYPSMAERLLANSVIDEEHAHAGTYCWRWIGKVKANRSGMLYGVLTRRVARGPRKGKVVNEFAHRMSLKTFKRRRMTPRMVGAHLCNFSLCINPEHLVGCSQRANIRQCVRDGRHRNGSSK